MSSSEHPPEGSRGLAGEAPPDPGAGAPREDPADLEEEDLYAGPVEEDLHTGLPPKLEGWRRRSAAGAVLTGFALGLQQVFEPEKEQPAVIIQTSGEPPKDLPVEAHVTQDRPRDSVVSVRPWLLFDSPADPAEEEPSGGEGS